jgi:hypothetical protein
MDRSLLARATDGTDAPTPGYLYVDLARQASANPSACRDAAQYLAGRLASKGNPNVKHKCCKVLARLCDAVPRNQFRRCVAQDHNAVAAIKDAMNYRGRPDPVRGDEPNQKVRLAAKEALDAVYREAPSSEAAAPVPVAGYGGGGVSSSYGPSPHGGGGGGGGYQNGGAGAGGGYSGGGGGPRRMEGIGNPRYQDPRIQQHEELHGFKGALREAGEVITGMIKDPLARNIPDHPVPRQGHSGNLPGYGGPAVRRTVREI